MPTPFTAVNLLLSFTAIVANTLILVALGKVSSIRAPTKLLFRFLAIIDLCVGLVSLPLGVVVFDFQQIREVKVNVYQNIYRVHIISTFVLSEISIVISTLISIDRVLALSLGWKYRHVTLKRVRTLLICLFCTRFVLTVPCFIRQDYLMYPPIFFTFFLLSMFGALLTSVSCYVKIFLKLKENQTHVRNIGSQDQTAGSLLNVTRYKKTVSSIAWIQLALLVCFLPFGTLCVGHLVLRLEYSVDLWRVVTLYLYLNATLNPLLLCWKIADFKRATRDTIENVCCFCR